MRLPTVSVTCGAPTSSTYARLETFIDENPYVFQSRFHKLVAAH
jgi:hypothetical protein